MARKGLSYLQSASQTGELDEYTQAERERDQQQEQERLQAQAQANKAEREQRRRDEGLGPDGAPQRTRQRKPAKPRKEANPLNTIGNAVKGAGDFLEDRVQDVREGVAGAFGVDKDELTQRTNQGRIDRNRTENDLRGVTRDQEGRSANPGGKATSEAVRAVVGVPARLAEGVADTTGLAVDVGRTAVNAVLDREDNTRNPFHPEYIAPRLDTGFAVPETEAGQMAQGLITFAAGITIAHRQITSRIAPGLAQGAGGTKRGLFVRGEVSSAIADIFLTRGGDMNLTGLVQSMVPEEYRDLFIFALASGEEDGEFSARIKAIVEGTGLSGLGAVIGGIVRGRRAAQRALRQGRKADDALTAGLREAADEINVGSARLADDAIAEGRRFDEVRLRELDDIGTRQTEIINNGRKDLGLEAEAGAGRLEGVDVELEVNDLNSFIREAEAQGIDPKDPTLVSVRDQADRLTARRASVEDALDNGFTPADYEGLTWSERSSQFSPGDINRQAVRAADVNLDVDSGLGNRAPVSILTDGQIKSMQWDNTVEAQFRQLEKDFDLQGAARANSRSDADVVRAAQPVIADVLEGFDLPGFDVIRQLDERGMTEQVIRNQEANFRGSTTEGPGGVVAERRLTRSGVVVARAVVQDLVDRAYTHADRLIDLEDAASGPIGNLGDKLLDSTKALLQTIKATSQAAGGTTRSFGIDPKADPSALSSIRNTSGRTGRGALDSALQQIDQIRDSIAQGKPEAKTQLRQLAALLREAGPDPRKQVSFLRLAGEVSLRQATNQMINSIFSGPATHMLNVLGNIYTVAERPTSMMLHGVTRFNGAEFRAAMSGYKALTTGLGEAIGATFNVVKNGSGSARLSGGDKWLDGAQRSGQQLEQLRLMANTPGERFGAQLLTYNQRLMNSPLFDWPGRFLTGVDDGFQSLALRQWAHMDSTHRALLDPKTHTDVGSSIKRYLKEFDKKIDSKTGRIVDEDLKEWIAQTTFQGKPLDITKRFSNLVNHWPVLRFVVPVINTPSEILRYLGKHTLGINKWATGEFTEVMEAAAKGDPEALARKAVIEGRVALGAIIGGASTLWAIQNSDKVTGYGPPRGTAQHRAWQSRGFKPQSIKVGDKWVSYASIEPVATILGLAADSALLIHLGSGEQAERIQAQIAFSFGAAFTDKSYLSGVQDLAELVNPQTPQDRLVSIVQGIANNNLPYAGMRRAVFNAMSPYLREVRTQTEATLNIALGGLALRGENKVDPLTGRVIPAWSGGFFNAISPVKIHDAGEDDLKDALFDARFTFPQTKNGPLQVPLTPDEKAELHTIMFEQGLREELWAVIRHPGFGPSAEAWRERDFDPDDPTTQPPHVHALSRVWSQAKARAFQTMREENPSFDMRIKDEAQRRDEQKAGFTTGNLEDQLMQKRSAGDAGDGGPRRNSLTGSSSVTGLVGWPK